MTPAELLQELAPRDRALLDLVPAPEWLHTAERLDFELDARLGELFEAFDRAYLLRIPAGLYARELLDLVAWSALTFASAGELELALRWVLSSPESQFNKRRSRQT